MFKHTKQITKDGEYLIEFSDYYESVRGFVVCYNGAGDCIRGSGTATIHGSVHHKQWRIADEGDTTIDLAKSGPLISYTPPIFLGGILKIKVIVLGMIEGTIVQASFWTKS